VRLTKTIAAVALTGALAVGAAGVAGAQEEPSTDTGGATATFSVDCADAGAKLQKAEDRVAEARTRLDEARTRRDELAAEGRTVLADRLTTRIDRVERRLDWFQEHVDTWQEKLAEQCAA
jgi:uncharacterized protein HemX